jgi:hypothetical protein
VETTGRRCDFQVKAALEAHFGQSGRVEIKKHREIFLHRDGGRKNEKTFSDFFSNYRDNELEK